MNFRNSLISALCVVALTWSTHAMAQAAKPRKLSRTEMQAVDHCLSITLDCQLPDGGITMANHGKHPGAQVWIGPYFCDFVALSWLAAYEQTKNERLMEAARKWIVWSCNHQEPEGFRYDYVGTVGNYASNGKVDAWDSSASGLLLVIARYSEAGGTVTPQMRKAAKAALRCIEQCTDSDGLTWAKPTYQVKYLMDNVETLAGLRAAETLFRATGDETEATAAAKQAELVAKGLLAYWQGKEPNRFAWALHSRSGIFADERTFDGGMANFYPEGLAGLFGVSFVKAEAKAFDEVIQKFEPANNPESAGAERYLIAASRLGPKYDRTWRKKALQTAATFQAGQVYVFRTALMTLAILEGADWMPSVAKDAAENQPAQ